MNTNKTDLIDLQAAEILQLKFELERVNKRNYDIEVLFCRAGGALLAYNAHTPASTTWELIEDMNKYISILPPATPKGE